MDIILGVMSRVHYTMVSGDPRGGCDNLCSSHVQVYCRMHRRRFLVGATRTAATFGALRYLSSCRDAEPVARSTSTPPGGSFASLRDRYFVRALQLYPVTSTYLGGDGYSSALAGTNGNLRDWGPEALKSEAAFYREIERARQALDPARLESADRIDHTVLGAQIG